MERPPDSNLQFNSSSMARKNPALQSLRTSGAPGRPVAHMPKGVTTAFQLPATPPSGGLMQPARRLRLEHLYVAPGARGRGVGGALTEAMKARMARMEVVQWSVTYHAFNAEAGALYARHGAEPAVVTAAGRIAWDQAPPESSSRSTMPR